MPQLRKTVTDTEKLDALKNELVRQEIARRNPVDGDVIQVLVGDRVGIADDGRLIVLTETGAAEVGDETGYTKSFCTMLDELAKQRPALFKEKSGSETEKNPFAKGANFNITEQMVLLRTNPERAEYLQYLASAGKN